jgi:hypothetical protein
VLLVNGPAQCAPICTGRSPESRHAECRLWKIDGDVIPMSKDVPMPAANDTVLFGLFLPGFGLMVGSDLVASRPIIAKSDEIKMADDVPISGTRNDVYVGFALPCFGWMIRSNLVAFVVQNSTVAV